MDEAIGKLCRSLATFSNRLESSCDALKQSVDRRPIPLDSASTTFTQCLNRRVTSVNSDLDLLESMAFETVSFEELLGHCSEVFKKNQNDLLALQSSPSFSAFVPSFEDDIDIDIENHGNEDEEELVDDSSSQYNSSCLSSTALIEDDPLLDESLSLKNLGLSDACLATIASEANNKIGGTEESYLPATNRSEIIREKIEENLKLYEEPKLIQVQKDDYENLPKHMRSLASWEDLLDAIEKVNSYLQTKTSKTDAFQQDEISSLQLGHKARSYLLLLLRLNRLIVETTDGLISYRVINSGQL